MPLKLVPPREGKSPNFSIRGTYLGVYVDRSTGTHRRAVAAGELRKLEGRIERGEFPEKPPRPDAPTFLTAAVAYLKARPQSRQLARHIGRLIRHFGELPIDQVDQAAIDAAALALYPHVTAGSRNVYVYSPASAILHHAGADIVVHRPKGFQGRTITAHLNPEDAFAIIAAAETIDREFALLLRFLLYTGARVGEALALRCDDVSTDDRRAFLRTSKNKLPRTLRLRADLAGDLDLHIGERTGRVFSFRYGGHLHHLLARSKLAALGLACPRRRPIGWAAPDNRFDWVNFHSWRHTWATWMRRYGGLDIQGLVATGNWSDARTAARYAHVEAREEWDRVERLPGPDDRKTA